MYWKEIKWFFLEGETLSILIFVFTIMLVMALMALVCKEASIYSGSSAILGGLLLIWYLFSNMDRKKIIVIMAMILIFGGGLHLLLFGVFRIRAVLCERKKLRAEVERQLSYSLPNRENSFVRTRLNTVLRVTEKDVNADMGGAEGVTKPLKLEYVWQLLKKIKAAPITQAERLHLDEMEKMLSLYMHMESWCVEDVRTVNELCASLLKFSAKYVV